MHFVNECSHSYRKTKVRVLISALVCPGESEATQKRKAFFFFFLLKTNNPITGALPHPPHTHSNCSAPVLVVTLLPVSAERPAVCFVMPPLQQHPQTFGPSLHRIHPLAFHYPLNRTVQGH